MTGLMRTAIGIDLPTSWRNAAVVRAESPLVILRVPEVQQSGVQRRMLLVGEKKKRISKLTFGSHSTGMDHPLWDSLPVHDLDLLQQQ